ncbi:MAG: hypothetical protein AAF702_28755 [Chloroflexota bacterium]
MTVKHQITSRFIRIWVSALLTALLLAGLSPLLFVSLIPTAHAMPQMEIILSIEYDGVAPFDANDVDGSNALVRAGDAIGYRIDWNVNEGDVAELIVTVPLPAANAWIGVPENCLSSGVTTTSAISSDGTTLTCNLGKRHEGSHGTIRSVAKAGFLPDATEMPLTAYISDEAGMPLEVASNEVTVAIVAGEISWSLAKSFRRTASGGSPRGNWDSNTPAIISDITDANGEPGRIIIFPVILLNTATSLAGSGALDDSVPLIFDDYIGGLGGSSWYTRTRPATIADMTAAGLADHTPCGPLDYPMFRVPFGSPAVNHPDVNMDNVTPDSGTWTCNWGGEIGTGGSGVLNVSVTGYNTASSARPTLDSKRFTDLATQGGGDDYNGGSPVNLVRTDRAGRIAMAGQIAIFLPNADFDARLGGAATGTFTDFNEIGRWTDLNNNGLVDQIDNSGDGDFDDPGDIDEFGPWTHVDLDGNPVSDSSTGGAPTGSIATDTSSDDYQRLVLGVSDGGSYFFEYKNWYQERTIIGVNTTDDSRTNLQATDGHTWLIPTQTQGFSGIYAGDGTVVPGQHWTANSIIARNGNEHIILCQVYDTRTIVVEDNQPWRDYRILFENWPWASEIVEYPGQAGTVHHPILWGGTPFTTMPVAENVKYIVEYSSTPVQPSEGNIGAGPNDWNVQATCDDDIDGDNINDWSSDLSQFSPQPNPSGFGSIYPDIQRVRMRTLQPLDAERIELFVSVQAKPATPRWPLGTFLPTSANFTVYDGDTVWSGTGAWQNKVYDTDEHCASATQANCPTGTTRYYGDRVAIGAPQIYLVKGLAAGQQDADLDIGDTVTYRMTGQIDDDPALGATGVTFTDTLPPEMTYQSANPVPTSVSADGRTIVWNIGSVSTPYSQTLELTATIARGAPLQVITNTIVMNADGFAELSDEISVSLKAGNEEAAIVKSLGDHRGACTTHPTEDPPPTGWNEQCRLIDIGDPISYTIIVTNEGVTPLTNVRLIDVFPHSGDGTEPSGFANDTGTDFNPGWPSNTQIWPIPLANGDGRTPASQLDSAVTTFAGISGGAGGETILYTNETPANIHRDPNAPSNQVGGGTTWCDGIGGMAIIDSGDGCPASAADVTAARVEIATMTGGEARTYELTLDTVGTSNDCHVWTNTFGSRTDAIWLPVRSNDVTIMSGCSRSVDIEKILRNEN